MTEPTQTEVTEYRLRLARVLRRSESLQLRSFFGQAFADGALVKEMKDHSIVLRLRDLDVGGGDE